MYKIGAYCSLVIVKHDLLTKINTSAGDVLSHRLILTMDDILDVRRDSDTDQNGTRSIVAHITLPLGATFISTV